MLDTDLSGRGEATRLDIVKHVFEQFVAGDNKKDLPGRPNDIIGIVKFARYADAICPLTLDHDNLLEIARGLRTVRWLDRFGRLQGPESTGWTWC